LLALNNLSQQPSSNKLTISSSVRILTDDVEAKPILDFEAYSDTLANMVKGSDPKFSVGIYGEWGCGKTTLMKLTEQKLRNHGILTVWFNAWRYEREDQFAIIALLKTIAYAMGEHPIYRQVKPILLRALKILGKGLLHQIASRYISEKGIEDFEKNLLPKMDLLAEVDKDTIYFDGINKIEEEIRKISKDFPDIAKNRIVVFIDDLDRCSPKRALEVFESIKVFLDIEGFIFIVGLSHETVSKLLSAEFKEMGIKGEQYIRKIIQIPIMVPDWNNSDVEDLIKSLVAINKLDEKYSKIILDNKDLIASVVEPNPRELKRFINNFIIAHELYSINGDIDSRELLAIQTLKFRWNNFYRYYSGSAGFREEVGKYVGMSNQERHMAFKKRLNDKENPPLEIEQRLFEMDSANDPDLWNLLDKEQAIISNVKKWETYRRALKSTTEDVVHTSEYEQEPLLKDAVSEWVERGLEYNRRRLYAKAIESFDKAIGGSPSSDRAWNNKGLALFRLGQIEEAYRCFDKVLTEDKDNVEALTYLGILHNFLRKFDEAEGFFKKALKKNRNHAPALIGQAHILIEKQKYRDAEDRCNKVLGLEPDNVEALTYLGLALYYLDKIDHALDQFNEALEKQPGYAPALTGRGICLHYRGQNDEAMQCFDKAIREDPEYASAWYHKGILLDYFRKHDEAMQCFDKAINKDPSNWKIWRHKCDTLEKMGKRDEAYECRDKLNRLQRT
jgi:tetratricopeptide (TPR) repeat protein